MNITKIDNISDRELLELAAKGAGLALEWCAEWCGGQGCYMTPVVPEPVNPILSKRVPWNPLTDDSDALRLAVACCISFGIAPDTGRMRVAYFVGSELHMLDMPEDHPMALPASEVEWLRRAIVRAVASIGKAMP